MENEPVEEITQDEEHTDKVERALQSKIAARDQQDNDDAEPPQAAADVAAPQPEPPQQKRNRWREMNDRVTAAETARDAAEQRERQLTALYQERVKAAAENAARPPAQDPDEQYKAAVGAIRREQNLLHRELKYRENELTQADIDRIQTRADELEEERIGLAAERKAKALIGNAPRSPGAHPLMAALYMKYPDVLQNDRAREYARSYFGMQKALGRPESMSLVEESYDRARKDFRTVQVGAPQVRPDANSGARMSGIAAGPSASGGSAPEPQWDITPSQRKMANASYEHLPKESDRIAAWRKRAGARLQKKMQG